MNGFQQRVGIKQRHIAADDEVTSDLAVHAARRALDNARISPAEIDLIVVATTTPDLTFPATAAIVQRKLGMRHGAAFDIQAVCSGFVYGMVTADSFLKNGVARRALVIGAEDDLAYPRLDRPLDLRAVRRRSGAPLVLGTGRRRRALVSSPHRSAPMGIIADKLNTTGGPSSTRSIGYVHMEGKEVFRHAVGKITDVVENVLSATGYTVKDLDWFVAAPGQSAHHRRRRRKAPYSTREGGHHSRPPRQHLGGIGATGADRGGQRWPHQARRSGDDRGNGWRLHLGQPR